jgi:hypothetical protein
MHHTLRSVSRRLRRSPGAGAPQATAPRDLRRRVLASVRGEANNSRVRMRRGRGVPILVVIALAVAAGLYVGISPTGHSGSAKPLPATVGVQASLRRIGSRAELLVSGMPEPPIGEVYEVWLTRASGAPHPTDALFTVSRAGKASVYVPGSLRGVREITVTSEPLGGSAHPTTEPVLRVALAQSR